MSFSRNLPDEGIAINGLVGVSDQPPPPNPIPHESIAFPFCFQQIKISQVEGGKAHPAGPQDAPPWPTYVQ